MLFDTGSFASICLVDQSRVCFLTRPSQRGGLLLYCNLDSNGCFVCSFIFDRLVYRRFPLFSFPVEDHSRLSCTCHRIQQHVKHDQQALRPLHLLQRSLPPLTLVMHLIFSSIIFNHRWNSLIYSSSMFNHPRIVHL